MNIIYFKIAFGTQLSACCCYIELASHYRVVKTKANIWGCPLGQTLSCSKEIANQTWGNLTANSNGNLFVVLKFAHMPWTFIVIAWVSYTWLTTHNQISTILAGMLWVRTCCLTMYCLIASCRCFSAGAVPHHCHEASDNIAWRRAFQFWDGLQRYIKYLALHSNSEKQCKGHEKLVLSIGF